MKNLFVIAKDHEIPCILASTKENSGSHSARKLQTIVFSNGTVQRRITKTERKSTSRL